MHGLDFNDRKRAYNCDVVYGTNNEFGFDYLRDNMVLYKEQVVQKGVKLCNSRRGRQYSNR